MFEEHLNYRNDGIGLESRQNKGIAHTAANKALAGIKFQLASVVKKLRVFHFTCKTRHIERLIGVFEQMDIKAFSVLALRKTATEISPPYTRLYYMIDGQCEIKTSGGELLLKAGNLYLLPSGHSFSHSCDHEMQQLYFHVNLVNSYGADILCGIGKILSKELSKEYVEELLFLFREDSAVARGYLKTLLQADIFSLLSENKINLSNKRLSDSVRRAIKVIEDNLSLALTVKTVSDSVSVSHNTLSHKFKKEMGIPIGKYIDGMIMHKAERLLINTDLPVARISEELGFYDQFYFSRRFKEKYAVSPLKYRRINRSAKQNRPPIFNENEKTQ